MSALFESTVNVASIHLEWAIVALFNIIAVIFIKSNEKAYPLSAPDPIHQVKPYLNYTAPYILRIRSVRFVFFFFIYLFFSVVLSYSVHNENWWFAYSWQAIIIYIQHVLCVCEDMAFNRFIQCYRDVQYSSYFIVCVSSERKMQK